MIPYSRPKFSDFYTLSQAKLFKTLPYPVYLKYSLFPLAVTVILMADVT